MLIRNIRKLAKSEKALCRTLVSNKASKENGDSSKNDVKVEFGAEKSKIVRRNRMEQIEIQRKMDTIRKDQLKDIEWLYGKEKRFERVKNLADIYDISVHVLKEYEFFPKCLLDVDYYGCKVGYGNRIEPSKVLVEPNVKLCLADSIDFIGKLHTFVALNIDGNLFSPENEVLLSMSVNVPLEDTYDSLKLDFFKGDTLYKYLPPIPWQASGLHRIVFLCFRQSSELSPTSITSKLLESVRTNSPVHKKTLERFQFNTYRFIKRHGLTPMCMSWFQTAWDPSVSVTCREIYKMKEPIFEVEEFNDYETRKQLFFSSYHARPSERTNMKTLKLNEYAVEANKTSESAKLSDEELLDLRTNHLSDYENPNK